MTWLRYILGLLVALILSAGSAAEDLTHIQSQIVQGEYASAYASAENLETAEGQALAAEILLSEIMLGLAEKNKKQAKRARKLAEAALEIDHTHQNARLQYAIADGFVTRETSNVSAWMKKLPQKTEDIVQAYRTDFPDDPRGDALMGAWHLAIARKAGNKNAEKWFNATISKGRDLFLIARAQRPDDIVIGINYAFSLLALEDEDFPDIEEARYILTEMVRLQPEDRLGEILKAYAAEALTRIENRDDVRDYVGLFLDGKIPE